MAEDRRVVLTKRLIKEALIELMEEYPISKISITLLCSRADVNRVTFYKYYKDPEDVLIDMENEILEKIPGNANIEDLSDEKRFIESVTGFFNYVKQNEKLFRILIVNADHSEFNRRLGENAMKVYGTKYKTGDKDLDHYSFVYMISGVMGILRAWIESGFSLESGKVAGIVHRLVERSLYE